MDQIAHRLCGVEHVGHQEAFRNLCQIEDPSQTILLVSGPVGPELVDPGTGVDRSFDVTPGPSRVRGQALGTTGNRRAAHPFADHVIDQAQIECHIPVSAPRHGATKGEGPSNVSQSSLLER